MADEKDKKIGEVPHLEQVTGKEKIPVSADDKPAYIEVEQIYDKEVTPYPKANQIVYTTTDGEVIELTDANLVSNVYYKDKGYGVMTMKDSSSIIRHPSFQSQETLETILCGKLMNSLGDYSYQNCINLKKVHFLGDVDIISQYCFQGCIKLEDINLPFIMRTIGINAFKGCKSLTSVIYPKADNGTNIFEDCISLINVTISDGVVKLPHYTFRGCTSLKSVTLPDSVKNIEWEVFKNCTSLYYINLSNIETFGGYAFQGCASLRNIELANVIFNENSLAERGVFQDSGLTSIDLSKCTKTIVISSESFKRCYSLNKIILPASLESIKLGAFDNTTPTFIDSSMKVIENFPPVRNLETLILRSPTLVEDVDTYVSTFTLEEGQELPQGATLLPKPEIATVAAEEGIMPMTNLDQYIGTPNNWLKIYVPNNLLKAYQERYPTLKSHFHPITGEDIYATKDEVKEEITKVEAEGNSKVFIDLWNDACGNWGKYNEETGYFELNGLTDITYEEALTIYNEKGNFFEYSKSIKGRTNIFIYQPNGMKYSMANAPMVFSEKFANSPIEILSLGGQVVGLYGVCKQMFYKCSQLREIKGTLFLQSLNSNSMLDMFVGCSSLEIIHISDIHANISFVDSPKIKYSCFIEMIRYVANSPVITVHPDIYSALQGTAPEYPFNGGTQEEWEQLLIDATEKNIQFATA